LLCPPLISPLVLAQDASSAQPESTDATIVVNSAGDEGDPDTGDGICDTTGKRTPPTDYSGLCTLRAAIQTANNTPAADIITFSGAFTIQPAAVLTSINYPVTIDGDGQVILDGSLLAGMSAGLAAFSNGGGSTIQGLTIRKFGGWGVLLGDSVGGSTVQDNILRENGIGVSVSSSTPGNTIASNTIILNTGNGVALSSNDNVVKGNKIGSDGSQDLGNSGHGVSIGLANGNLIGGAVRMGVGGACTGDCNLIAGNGGSGVRIGQGTDPTKGVNNTVRGNFIGVNLAGNAALPNDANGVSTNGDSNWILGNLISGNGVAGPISGNHGIYLEAGATSNLVQGNLIGAAIDGKSALGNFGAGVNVSYANENVIGSAPAATLAAPPAACTGDCNVILGNSAGISITQAVSPGLNQVIGNFIGVSADGESAPGNRGNGIFMQGMTMTVAANVIGGNLGNGVEILGVAVGSPLPINSHKVQGNHIGVGPDGSANMSNQGHGILISRSADNWIGGLEAGQGNLIAHNGYNGDRDGVVIVEVSGLSQAIANRILGNSIYENGANNGIGIDLRGDGPTPNDPGDGDLGPNQVQNYPVISWVRGATVVGELESAANTTFRLEFFASPECSATGFGQGKTFLGAFDVTTDGDGLATFEQALPTAPGAQRLTATATDPAGNTSEFSACYNALVVNSTGDRSDAAWDGFCDTGQLNANGDPECTLRAALQEASFVQEPSTILFDIPFTTGFATISPQSRLPDVNNPIFIDGSSQPDVEIILDGSQAGAEVDGLRFYGGSSTVRGLTVVGFGGYGLAFYQMGNNVIVGNRIGVEPMGFANGSGRAGIALISGDNNRIGGSTPAEANVIGSNGGRTGSSGIFIDSLSKGHQILGNFIGVLPDGTLRGNDLAGIYVDRSPENVIGGGVSTPKACAAPCNVIAGGRYGVILAGAEATHNQVTGNLIGLNPAGTAAAPNTEWGVIVDNAPGNFIAHNVISGNGPVSGLAAGALPNGDGVILNGGGARQNVVTANLIGLNPAGTAALANVRSGVWIEEAPENTVIYNRIAGNLGSGLTLHGVNATGNIVHSNHIGLNGLGDGAIPNQGDGITVDGSPGNTFGGPSQANQIAGNSGQGIHILGQNAQDNLVTGNRIGVNPAQGSPLPNDGDGVRIAGSASRNTVGGTLAGDDDANIIGGNAGDGVRLDGAGTTNNTVAGNFIGVLADGETPLANQGHGVQIANGSSNNTVGGGVSDHANRIAFNWGDGIYVAAGAGNALWQNQIWRNGGLGIDLGVNGVTPNDALDADVGPNHLQNFPILASVQADGDGFVLKGSLASTATLTYTLEFFANRICDPSGFGEGEIPLGRATVSTDGDGWAVFTFSPAMTFTHPISFTVTATDPNRNTSEFSPCAGPSTEAALTPATGGVLAGDGVTVTVPAGAVAADFTLSLLPLAGPAHLLPDGMTFGGLAFLLNAFVGGVQQEGFVFQQPVMLSLTYRDEDVAGLDEDALTLQTWDGAAWVDAATTCTPPAAYSRQPEQNRLGMHICHLSEYALVVGAAPIRRIYLPLVLRN
jgi:CSLREA domain-containing protein